MLSSKLKDFNIILASASPRRHDFFKGLNLDFDVQLKPIKEVYPDHLKQEAITDYLAKLKAEPFKNQLQDKDLLITSDTIVWHNDAALGKPKNADDAFKMIKSLCNATHQVISSICFTQPNKQQVKHTSTKVTFKALSDQEIWYYIKTFKPFDKAGAYGIQEWIGAVAITKIEGSYNNVVGLPTHLLYETLNTIAEAT